MYQQLDVQQYRSRGPNVLHSATELPRVMLEMTSLAWCWPLLGSAPRGDGHRVLVLPGFMGGDDSTAILRRFLTRLGYQPLPWTLGQNNGSYDIQERLVRHVLKLTRENDERISLVGQSLGGVYARELARQFSPHVRQVITLGSPFASTSLDNTNALVGRLFEYMSGRSLEDMREEALAFTSEPPPVPSTSIYSKSDGVVHWTTCLESPGYQAENIEVLGSHTGMAMNPLVFHLISDRLAQPHGAWRPFKRTRGCESWLFPEPARPTARNQTNTEVDACAN